MLKLLRDWFFPLTARPDLSANIRRAMARCGQKAKPNMGICEHPDKLGYYWGDKDREGGKHVSYTEGRAD